MHFNVLFKIHNNRSRPERERAINGGGDRVWDTTRYRIDGEQENETHHHHSKPKLDCVLCPQEIDR